MLKDFINKKLLKVLADLEKRGHAVFFQYSGHIDSVSIFVAESSEKFSNYLYFENIVSLADLDRIIGDLHELLEKLGRKPIKRSSKKLIKQRGKK